MNCGHGKHSKRGNTFTLSLAGVCKLLFRAVEVTRGKRMGQASGVGIARKSGCGGVKPNWEGGTQGMISMTAEVVLKIIVQLFPQRLLFFHYDTQMTLFRIKIVGF